MKTAPILILILISISAPAIAKPPSHFHEGPYFMLNGGILNFSVDNNVRTGAKVGRNIEPTVGFNFGWNFTDSLAPELMTRYSTSGNGGNREHIAIVNLSGVYCFVTDQLTGSKSVRLLPFIQGGVAAEFAAIPGDPASTDRTMAIWGPGIGTGAGLRILFKQYVYMEIITQSDFIYLQSKFQGVGGVRTKIMQGGWDAQLSASGLMGVHF